MELSIEQRKAIALATAKQAAVGAQGQAGPAAAPEAWNPIAGLSRDVVNGIPILGPLYTRAVDEVTTRIIGAITGEDPGAMRERVTAKQHAYEEQNPGLSFAGNLVGGMTAMAPLAATQLGARAFGLTGRLLQRSLFGAGSGAAVSGVDSLVRGNDPGDALAAAGGGLVLGGAVAAGAPHIANAVKRGAESIAGLFGRPPATPAGMSRPAVDMVTRALMADGTLGNQGLVNIGRGGANAMLADAGPNARALLDTAVQRSGPGSRIAIDAIDGRATQAYGDVTRAMDSALGVPQGVHTVETALRQGTAAARSATYDAAYAAPIDYSSEAGRQIETLMQRVPASVLSLAKRMMEAEGVASRQMFASIADDGAVTITRMPDVRELDYVTRALNQAARSGEGQGALGGQTDIGRIYGNLGRDIRTATKEAVPEYAAALETAAHPIRQREALQFGADLMSPKVPRDVVRDELRGMTGPERAAVKQGIRSQIDEALANVKAAASDPNIDIRAVRKVVADLSSPAAREKISMAIGSEADATALFAQLDQAAQALELRAATAANSRTFARGAVDEVMGAHFDQGVINQALQGKPINVAQAAVQNVTGRTPQGVSAMKDKAYEEIVQALVGARGQDASGLLINLAGAAKAGQPVASFLPGAVSPAVQAVSAAMLGR